MVDRQILNEENKKLRSIISDVEKELNEDHSHQWEFCSGCALCIIEEGLKDLEHINDAEDEAKDRPNTTAARGRQTLRTGRTGQQSH